MPIRAGMRIALATLGTVLVVVMLKENGLLEFGHKDVYFVASVCKDVLLCCPEFWEQALNDLLRSLWNKMMEFFRRITNPPHRENDDEEELP